MNNDLLPCPFCGASGRSLIVLSTTAYNNKQVFCMTINCRAMGPMALNRDGKSEDDLDREARELWNRRAALAEDHLQRVCCNPDCDWTGPGIQCVVHPHHWPEDRLCPKCSETTKVL
jgi:hypothetical protein